MWCNDYLYQRFSSNKVQKSETPANGSRSRIILMELPLKNKDPNPVLVYIFYSTTLTFIPKIRIFPRDPFWLSVINLSCTLLYWGMTIWYPANGIQVLSLRKCLLCIPQTHPLLASTQSTCTLVDATWSHCSRIKPCSCISSRIYKGHINLKGTFWKTEMN